MAAVVAASCGNSDPPKTEACGGQEGVEVCLLPTDSGLQLEGSGFQASSVVKLSYDGESEQEEQTSSGKLPANGRIGVVVRDGVEPPKVTVTGTSSDGTAVSFVVFFRPAE